MTNKDSYILGLNLSHNATACLMKNGKVIGLVSEERFTRVKNQHGFPKKSVEYLLSIENINVKDIDLIVNGGRSLTPNWDPVNYTGFNRIVHFSLYTIASLHPYIDLVMRAVYKLITKFQSKQEALNLIKENLGVSGKKIMLADHHRCHAYAAYFGFTPKEVRTKTTTVATLDAEGDMLCATVWRGKNNKLELISSTSEGNSPAAIYADITRILGMKINEHEYKVMGLAPYSKEEYSVEPYKIISSLVTFDKKTLQFKSKFGQRAAYVYLSRKLSQFRFDAIAYAIQKWTEEMMTAFIDASVKKTKSSIVSVGGGWFMNVKANMEVAKLKSVSKYYICPSCGDESLAIGACYVGYEKLFPNNHSERITDLYLGPDFSDKEALKAIRNNKGKYKVDKVGDMESRIAVLISRGKTVARFSGRMEWGARALGNRSILSDPRNVEVKKIINEQIKNRDFWMPFAPSVNEKGARRYLVNPKGINGNYMIMAYPTTRAGAVGLKAAIHPYDETARPQVVAEEMNPKYAKIINLFEKKTGISGVLNTSFNLHGYPIVCTPDDAIKTFLASGLEYLALNNYLLTKN